MKSTISLRSFRRERVHVTRWYGLSSLSSCWKGNSVKLVNNLKFVRHVIYFELTVWVKLMTYYCVEMDESSSSMFVWFIWCSLVLTKRNEKLAKQFIRTVHEQSTFLHVLRKCGNNKSVCIISHIIVPALVTFQISRRQTSYH